MWSLTSGSLERVSGINLFGSCNCNNGSVLEKAVLILKSIVVATPTRSRDLNVEISTSNNINYLWSMGNHGLHSEAAVCLEWQRQLQLEILSKLP
jgi:hypothetical protein